MNQFKNYRAITTFLGFVVVVIAALLVNPSVRPVQCSQDDPQCKVLKERITKPRDNRDKNRRGYYCEQMKDRNCSEYKALCEDDTDSSVEGTWSVRCCHKDSNDSQPRHIQTFVITKLTDGYKVWFKDDDPKNDDSAEFTGDDVTLNRKNLKAPEPDKQTTQTWTGKLVKGSDGKLRIEGKITGAGMPWLQQNGFDTRFVATKQ